MKMGFRTLLSFMMLLRGAAIMRPYSSGELSKFARMRCSHVPRIRSSSNNAIEPDHVQRWNRERDPLSNHPEIVAQKRDTDLLFESQAEVQDLLKRRQEIKELEADIQQNVKDLKRSDYGIKLQEFMRHSTDTGSPEFQIARATQRIRQLVCHMEEHRKDLHSRRGLEMVVQDRRRMLKYLRRTNLQSYKTICEKLGIHDRVPPSPTYPAVGRRYGLSSGRQEKLKNSKRPIGMPF